MLPERQRPTASAVGIVNQIISLMMKRCLEATEKQERLRIDSARLAHWKSKGAQLSDTVARLVKQLGAPKAA